MTTPSVTNPAVPQNTALSKSQKATIGIVVFIALSAIAMLTALALPKVNVLSWPVSGSCSALVAGFAIFLSYLSLRKTASEKTQEELPQSVSEIPTPQGTPQLQFDNGELDALSVAAENLRTPLKP